MRRCSPTKDRTEHPVSLQPAGVIDIVPTPRHVAFIRLIDTREFTMHDGARPKGDDTPGALGPWLLCVVNEAHANDGFAPDALFPEGVVFEQVDPGLVDVDALHATEFSFVANAVASRQKEFAAGRCCARRALATLGTPIAALPVNRDRRPAWPLSVVGSISHTDGYCGAAVGRREQYAGLGFDAEPALALPDEVRESVLTHEELRHLCRLPEREQGIHARLLFSAKEAFYKCFRSVDGHWLDFHDIEILPDEEHGYARAQVHAKKRIWDHNPQLVGRYVMTSRFIFTSFTQLPKRPRKTGAQ